MEVVTIGSQRETKSHYLVAVLIYKIEVTLYTGVENVFTEMFLSMTQ